MSVMIKVKYETDEELKTVLSLLDPIIKEWNKSSKHGDRFRKVYIRTELKSK